MSSRNHLTHRVLPLAALLVGLSLDAQAIDLLQSYRLAIQNDARYQIARAEAAVAREAAPQAQAQLLPNISLSLMRSDRSSDIWSPNMLGKMSYRRQDYLASNYAVTLRQPIYRRYNFVLYEQALDQVTSAEATLDRNLQDMVTRLTAAYFDALGAEDQMRLVQAQKAALTAQLQAAKRRLQAGQGTRTDIDDAQARYDMALAQELEAEQNIDQTRRQLQSIIKQPVEQLAGLVPEHIELTPPYPADPEEWVKRGEENNAELRSLRANVDAAEKEIAKATSGHHPTLDLIAQRSRSTSDGETVINQEYLTTSVGLQLNIPLFAGGYNSSQVRQAEAGLERARNQYEGRRREIELAIRKEFQNVAQGILKVRAQEQSERSARQAILSSQKGYQAGQRTLPDILNAQQQAMNVQRDLTAARLQYILARIKLQGLVGTLNEEELTAVNRWLDFQPSPENPASQNKENAEGKTAGPVIAPVLPSTSPKLASLRFTLPARGCPIANATPFSPSPANSLRFPLIETCES